MLIIAKTKSTDYQIKKGLKNSAVAEVWLKFHGEKTITQVISAVLVLE